MTEYDQVMTMEVFSTDDNKVNVFLDQYPTWRVIAAGITPGSGNGDYTPFYSFILGRRAE